MNPVQLKFVLEAERKQRIYAEQRAAWTEPQLRAFKAWQDEITRARERLLGLVVSRAIPSST